MIGSNSPLKITKGLDDVSLQLRATLKYETFGNRS